MSDEKSAADFSAAREKMCLNQDQLRELRAFLSGSTFGVNRHAAGARLDD